MSKLYSSIVFFIVCFSSYSQEVRFPSIIIINSQETIISKELDSIVKKFESKGISEHQKQKIINENGKFRLKTEKEIEFLQEVDISTKITYGLNYFLSYKFFEYFEDLLIYPIKESIDSTKESLESISQIHNVNWVINFKKLEFYKEEQYYKGRAEYLLYNQKEDEIVINSKIIADDSNPGFEFVCQPGSIECVINNIIDSVSADVIEFMGQNKEYWRMN
ncbi:hypothetical protein [Winogradskyella sp.]|uniref:hypothetical protein n=1 Tax=Winogradskyella sp. TaxID=1883156 RepID=UPI00261C5E1F|nr:hypothetical protein [Winogradskyella sp.]